MNDKLSCSAAGITEVIIDDLNEDAKIRSVEGLEEILVTVKLDAPDTPRLNVEGDKAYLRDGFATRIEIPRGVALSIGDALGDLKITRFDGDLTIDEVMGDLRIEEVSGRVDINHCYGDVRAEEVAQMRVRDCEGDFRFSGGDLEIEAVNGDLRVTDAGSLHCLRVHGDLWVERMSGSVKVEATHGDARLLDIEGAAGLGMASGDLRATNVRGALNVGQAHGDAQLEGPFPAAEGYAINALGDLHIRLLAEDDARLTARALGRVRSNLPLTPSADGSATYTTTLGEGRVRIALTANGDLRIEAAAGGREDVRGPGGQRWGASGDPFADLSGLGDRIRQQVSASLAAAGINPETGEFSFNFGPAKVRGGRGRAPEPPRPPTPPQPPRASQATMSGEQMVVLKMLEEGRITPEEADALLRALGA